MASSKEKVVEEFTKPVAKLIIVISALFVINTVLGFLPGMESLIVEDAGLTVANAATAVLTLVGVIYTAKFGRSLNPKIRNVLETEIVEDIALFTENLVYLLAIIAAYRSLSGTVLALVPIEPAFYDFVFLLMALYPTGKIALNIYDNLDGYADLITEKAVSQVEDED